MSFSYSAWFQPIRRLAVLSFGLALACSPLWGAASVAWGADGTGDKGWQHWRQTSGVAPEGNYPVEWKGDNGIQWRREIAGRGGSTPVVAGDLIFITYGEEGKNRLAALSTDTGETVWESVVGDDRGGKHQKGSGSNPSPTTDGEHVYVYYRSGDVACIDLQGNIVWRTNLQDEYGEDTLWWDLGSSPVLTGNSVIIAVMQSPPSPSYLLALDKQTGEKQWMVKRELNAPEEAAQSYTSPLVATVDGKEIIAVLGADHLTLHAADSGNELGRLGGFNPAGEKYFRSIASPVIGDNIIVCPYARGATLTAVDMVKLMEGAGEDAIQWQRDDLGADVPTPAVLDGRLYVCQDRGEVQTLDLQTGKTIWEQKLPRHRANYSSSPLVTSSHLYLTREDGHVFVIALPNDKDAAELVSENELGDDSQYTVASPVPMPNSLLFRTAQTLVKIGTP